MKSPLRAPHPSLLIPLVGILSTLVILNSSFCTCPLMALDANDSASSERETPVVRVGSKNFTESVILGEILVRLAGESGATAEHRDSLGGTRVLWNALLAGEIDVYPDYTGTLTEEIFAGRGLQGNKEIRSVLAEHGVMMSRRLGFNNTYAIGMKESVADRLGLRTISDLREHPELAFGFSNEFMARGDGWPKLKEHYRLPHEQVRGLDHDLAYRGLESGSIDATDLYSTDAEIQFYGLRVLEDDLEFFPIYDAVILYRRDLTERAPHVVESLLRIEGRIPEEKMIAMNTRVKLDKIPEPLAAANFLKQEFGVQAQVTIATRTDRLLRYTLEHLYLVALSVFAAIVVAIPLGILAAKQRIAGQITLATVGILQTVPSLAMFVFLIPLLGLGAKPAICALFLYSLLPIVRNTYAGLHDIPLEIHESAQALGLPPAARLRLIELPMAARSILAGVKTAVVINVGTATLGGFIDAGGYGDPIFTGIRLARTDLVLEGAIPAAVMALIAQGFFELIERCLVPKGLRLKAGE